MAAIISSCAGVASTLQSELGYPQRVQIVLAASIICGVYLKLVVGKVAPSYTSLVYVVPVVAFNTWLPLLFHYRDEMLSRTSWLLLLGWLGSFKAVGLCFGRGPLAGPWTAAQTVLLYVLPLYPRQDAATRKGRLADNAGSSGQVAMSFASNTLLLVICASLLITVDLPMIIKYYVYALGLYGFITFLMEGPAAALIALLDLQVVPPFDKPWLSTSLADFWSRRWNNSVSLMLRALVYDPIVEGQLMASSKTLDPETAAAGDKQSGSKAAKHQQGKIPLWQRLAGMAATFAVSGFMHEWILHQVTPEGAYQFGWWFMFFFVQAPLLVVEGFVQKRLKKAGVKLSRAVGIGYTTCFMLLTSYAFWFPPIEDYTDIATHVATSVNNNVLGVLAGMQQLAEHWGVQQAVAATFGTHAAGSAAV